MAMAEDKDVSDLPKNGGPHIVTKTFVDEYDSGRNGGDGDEESCGWGPFKPGFCQRFRDPKWVLFWLCWAGAIQVRYMYFVLLYSYGRALTSIKRLNVYLNKMI